MNKNREIMAIRQACLISLIEVQLVLQNQEQRFIQATRCAFAEAKSKIDEIRSKLHIPSIVCGTPPTKQAKKRAKKRAKNRGRGGRS